MPKPELLKVANLQQTTFQEYERYLPTAFDESMTYLEKINKIIHYMNTIGKLTQEMIDKWNEVYEWIMGKGLEDAVNKKLEEWLLDGTIDKIINQKLFGELKAMIQALYDLENVFEIKDIQPEFIMNLGGLRNAVNQSIHIHPGSLDVYTTQSDSNTPEGFYLTKMNPSGHYDSAMVFPEAGHGTSVGLDHTNGGENPYIWFHHLYHNKLVRITYQANTKLNPGSFSTLKDYTPASLKGLYFSVSYDPYFDNLCFRIDDGRVQVRSRADVVNEVDRVLYSCTIPESERNSDRPMQGCISYDSTIYYQSGTSSMDNVMKIFKYDGKTGNLIYSHTVRDLLAEEGMYEFHDDFKEPEGMAYFVHPKTKKHSLLFVITTGDGNKRYHLLYAFNQRHASNHWDSVARMGGQNYGFTRGDGRYKSLPKGTTHLDQLTKPGLYYITGGEADTIGGFPYPTETTAWELYVGPLGQTYNQLQVLRRLSITRRIMEFQRVLEFDRDTFDWTGDKWTVNLKGSTNMEYLQAEHWNGKLANLVMPGEYYLTSSQANAFTDMESDNAGWRLTITSADSSEQIQQILVRNSDTRYQMKFRNVHIDTKATSRWFMVHDIPIS